MTSPAPAAARVASKLRVMTWNISCLETSASAPASWTPETQLQSVVSEILAVEPDLLALQEVTRPLKHPDLKRRYTEFGCAPSHCGTVRVMVKRDAGLELVKFMEEGPAVIAHMSRDGREFFFVAAHLAPFKDGARARIQQLLSISELLPQKLPVVLAADSNMREDETDAAEAAVACQDAFKLVGAPAAQKFTWDSRKNKFHEEGFGFTCRFDRIFVRRFDVVNFKLAANKPASDNAAHFLSDHFALVSDLEFAQ